MGTMNKPTHIGTVSGSKAASMAISKWGTRQGEETLWLLDPVYGGYVDPQTDGEKLEYWNSVLEYLTWESHDIHSRDARHELNDFDSQECDIAWEIAAHVAIIRALTAWIAKRMAPTPEDVNARKLASFWLTQTTVSSTFKHKLYHSRPSD
jgi:hypothetical protein